MQQRCALASDPGILLLDESFAALKARLMGEIREEERKAATAG